MASLAARAARQAANSIRASSAARPVGQPSNLIQRRGMASDADHHGTAKVNFWTDPKNPSNWKEEHLVLVSLGGWAVFITSLFKICGGDKKEEKVAAQ